MNNDNNNELINHLREKFTGNFNTLNKRDITERAILTKVMRTPNDDIIHTINTAISRGTYVNVRTDAFVILTLTTYCIHLQSPSICT